MGTGGGPAFAGVRGIIRLTAWASGRPPARHVAATMVMMVVVAVIVIIAVVTRALVMMVPVVPIAAAAIGPAGIAIAVVVAIAPVAVDAAIAIVVPAIAVVVSISGCRVVVAVIICAARQERQSETIRGKGGNPRFAGQSVVARATSEAPLLPPRRDRFAAVISYYHVGRAAVAVKLLDGWFWSRRSRSRRDIDPTPPGLTGQATPVRPQSIAQRSEFTVEQDEMLRVRASDWRRSDWA